MEFSYFSDKNNNTQSADMSNYLEDYEGWRKLCATDCNGIIHNIGNSSKAHRCYLNIRRPEERNAWNKKLSKKSFLERHLNVSGTTFLNMFSKEVNNNKIYSLPKKNDNSSVIFNPMNNDLSVGGKSFNSNENKNLFSTEISYFSDKSPPNNDLFKSPTNNDLFKSPTNNDLFKSPTNNDLFKSPTDTNSFKSPTNNDLFKSPTNNDLFKSPTDNDLFKSPTDNDLFKSPTDTDPFKSPTDTDPFKSPTYTDPFKSPTETGSLWKFTDDEMTDLNTQCFTLFPEKSPSSPSIFSCLDSYFSKTTLPRSRCVSDPLSNYHSPIECPSESSSTKSQSSSSTDKSSPLANDTDSGNKNSIFQNELSDPPSSGSSSTGDNSSVPLGSFLPSFDTSLNQSINKTMQLRKGCVFENEKNSYNISVPFSQPSLISGSNSRLNNQVYPQGQYHDIYSFVKYPNQAGFSFNQPPVYYSIEAGKITCSGPNIIDEFQSLTLNNQNGRGNIRSENSSFRDQGKKIDNRKNNQQDMECKFCKSNMETPKTYKSHTLKKRIGKRTLVTCPVLRKVVCERCGGTGDNAHTLSYCPTVIAESGRKPISVAVELKKTKRVASGKIRKFF